MSSSWTFGLGSGGLGGRSEPDDGLGDRFTLGSVSGALANSAQGAPHGPMAETWAAGRFATARWATRRNRPPDRCYWASWRADRTIGRRPKREPRGYSPAVLTRARRPDVADGLVGTRGAWSAAAVGARPSAVPGVYVASRVGFPIWKCGLVSSGTTDRRDAQLVGTTEYALNLVSGPVETLYLYRVTGPGCES